jgi:hypothetical protein
MWGIQTRGTALGNLGHASLPNVPASREGSRALFVGANDYSPVRRLRGLGPPEGGTGSPKRNSPWGPLPLPLESRHVLRNPERDLSRKSVGTP